MIKKPSMCTTFRHEGGRSARVTQDDGDLAVRPTPLNKLTRFCQSLFWRKDVARFFAALERSHRNPTNGLWHARWAGLLFPGPVDFTGATFEGEADFRGATFEGDATFVDA